MIGSVSKLTQPLRVRDVMIIITVALPFFLLLVVSQSMEFINYGDVILYQNKGVLLFQGALKDFFVYNITYSMLVGVVNFIVRDLIIAGMIVNLFAILASLAGVYLVGQVLFNRSVAFLGALLLATNPVYLTTGHLLHPDIFFICVVIWSVLAAVHFIKRPSNLSAVILGGIVTFALYTRLEGVVYGGLLILTASGLLYYSTKKLTFVIRLAAISSTMLLIGTVLYMMVFIQNLEAGNFGNLLMLIVRSVPFRSDLMSWRINDTIVQTLGTWPLWVWWLVATISLCFTANWRQRYSVGILAGLILFNMAYVFVLSTWPGPTYFTHHLPFSAILLAFALWRIKKYSFVLSGLIAITLLYLGMQQFAKFLSIGAFAYRNAEVVQTAQSIDYWLESNGWGNTRIYTFCKEVIPLSHANFYLIERTATRRLRDLEWDNSWWNSPGKLLPQIDQQDELLMICSGYEYWPKFTDWRDYFQSGEQYPVQLQQVGRMGIYSFFQVVDAH